MSTTIVISDPHVNSGQDLSRFSWLANLILEKQPTRVVCLGDIATLDSCSFHEPLGSQKERDLPSLADDARSVKAAQKRLFDPLAKLKKKPEFILVKGNHEHRYRRWAQLNYRVASVIDFDQTFAFDDHWDIIKEYREFIERDGITYTHIPHTKAGRPIDGVGKSRRICLESRGPLLFGHGHDMQVATTGDIRGGPAARFAMSCPAFMVDGNIEKYAEGMQTGWAYGLIILRPQGDDRIPSYDYLSMKDLKEQYA